jgi:hypothetical protein
MCKKIFFLNTSSMKSGNCWSVIQVQLLMFKSVMVTNILLTNQQGCQHNYIPAKVSNLFGVSEHSLQHWKVNQAQSRRDSQYSGFGLMLQQFPDFTHDLLKKIFFLHMTRISECAPINFRVGDWKG